jgi:predicted Abi (CAAX) family protease
MISVLFIPVLAEELVFRVILLPHPFTEPIPISYWSLIATVILIFFILYHPILAKTAYRTADPLFLDPTFLTLAGFLGLACTATYWFTGSFWAVVFIHWVIDWVWLYLLGGRAKFSSLSKI